MAAVAHRSAQAVASVALKPLDRRRLAHRGLREIGAQRKRAASRVDRLLEPSKLAQRSGAARPGVRIVGRERRRRFERTKRLSETAGAEIELAGIDMGDDQRSVELERAPIEAQRRLGLAAFS